MSYDGTTKWKVSLKQAKTLRLVFRLLFVACAFVTPTLIIGFKYNIITRFSGYKLSVIGMFLLIAIAWAFKNKALEWVKTWEYSIWKYIILGISKVWLYILILIVLYAAQRGVDKLIFCAEWFAVCEIVAYLIIYPLEQRYDFIVKRMISKNERKEDVKEALRELEAENQ